MSETHLTPEQIVALRDGELRDAAVIRHLQTCPACRTRVREARVLRVLLSTPERHPSPHPDPEELAAYAEEALPSQDTRSLVEHLTACPECFADLEAIRAQLRPAEATSDVPPDWVVAAAVRSFQPAQPFIDLGRVVVAWLQRLGLSLEYLPPSVEAASQRALDLDGNVSELGAKKPAMRPRAAVIGFMRVPEKLASATPSIGEAGTRASIECCEVAGAPAASDMPPEPPEQEASPVEVPVGNFQVRLTARGRTHDNLRLTLFITRQSDGAPVADVHLTLETEEETLGPIATDAAGIAEFPVPPGQATLVFQSPIRAELKISF